MDDRQHVLGPFAALDHRFSIATNVGGASDLLRRLLVDLGAPGARGEREYRLEAVEAADGMRFRTSWKSQVLAETLDRAHALGMLLWHLNQQAVAATPGLVLVHAAGAARHGRAVVMPAPMESGKTTLVAGLVRAGLDYLSDEIVAVAPLDGSLLAYPKPLSLDPGSWALFPELRPPEPGDGEWMHEQWLAPAAALNGGRVSATADPAIVVFPRYEAGSATSLARLSRADALLRLAGCTFDFTADGPRNLQVLGRLARDSECYELRVGELSGACETVIDLVETCAHGA